MSNGAPISDAILRSAMWSGSERMVRQCVWWWWWVTRGSACGGGWWWVTWCVWAERVVTGASDHQSWRPRARVATCSQGFERALRHESVRGFGRCSHDSGGAAHVCACAWLSNVVLSHSHRVNSVSLSHCLTGCSSLPLAHCLAHWLSSVAYLQENQIDSEKQQIKSNVLGQRKQLVLSMLERQNSQLQDHRNEVLQSTHVRQRQRDSEAEAVRQRATTSEPERQ